MRLNKKRKQVNILTDKLYYKDITATNFSSEVEECLKVKNGYEIVLSSTAFFPEQGGQTADIGMLDGQHVNNIRISDDKIYHEVSNPIAKGTVVKGSVDWSRRFDFMQQHTGEHMLSGTIHRRFGFDNVGFHLSDSTTTLDINGIITDKMAADLENEVNHYIWQDIPVRCYFPDEKELANTEYRSKKELNDEIRLVSIENVDTCACCAPHVSSTGKVGLLKILSVRNYKGGVRITIACGGRALSDYSIKQKNTEKISSLLSATQSSIADAVSSLSEKEHALLTRCKGLEVRILETMFDSADVSGNPDVILFSHDIGMSSLIQFISGLEERKEGFSSVFSGDDLNGYSFVLRSDTDDNKIIEGKMKSFGFRFGGRGGIYQGSIKKSRTEIISFLSSC
jgi:alanyl-tRNA synthetase